MSYSHIMFVLGAVVLILAGGFVAIILIDLLFDVFDGIRAKWTARQQKKAYLARVAHSQYRDRPSYRAGRQR